MTSPKSIRPWSAKAQYPGLATFVLGTVVLPKEARHDEIVSALQDHAATFLPPGFEIIEPMCGALFFWGSDD